MVIMTIRLWKSKEERMHDDANTLLNDAEAWILVSGRGKYLNETDLKWIDETRAKSYALREAAPGARFGWEDLMRYVIFPLLIIGVPMMTAYLAVGRNIEESSLPGSVGAWWSFPLFCAVSLPTGIFLMCVCNSFDRAVMGPRREREIAAINNARDHIGALCDTTVVCEATAKHGSRLSSETS